MTLPGLSTGVWIDDLCAFDEDYLQHRFRPSQQGLTDRTVSVALNGAAPGTRAYLASQGSPEVRDLLARPLEPRARPGETLAAQTQVVATYFWEMAYHAHPDVYEQLTALQEAPLSEVFPPGEVDGKVVADLGTGGGRAVPYLAQHASWVWGIDPCEPLLEHASRKFPAERRGDVLKGAFDDLPLPDQSVDAAVSLLAFQVSDERGGKRGLAEIARVLRPGGHATLVVGNPATANFLRDQGLTERLPSPVLRWRHPPVDSSVLLQRLVELGGAMFDNGASTTTTPLWAFQMRKDAAR